MSLVMKGFEMAKPSEMSDPNSMSSLLTSRAKDVLLKDGFHSALFFLVGKDRVRVLEPDPDAVNDKKSKDMISMFVKLNLMQLKAEGIGMVMEAWVVRGGSESLEVTPSEHPDKKEMLVVTVEWKDGRVFGKYIEMIRDEEGKLIRLVENDKDMLVGNSKDNGGRFSGWFKEE